jgi:hypothetical protein
VTSTLLTRVGTVRAVGIVGFALLGACAGSGPSASRFGAPGPEPTMRNPLGYTGRPVDSSPTTSELEFLPGRRGRGEGR